MKISFTQFTSDLWYDYNKREWFESSVILYGTKINGNNAFLFNTTESIRKGAFYFAKRRIEQEVCSQYSFEMARG